MASIARFRLVVVGAALFVALAFILTITRVLGAHETVMVDDTAQFVAAVGATLAAVWFGYRSHGPSRWWRWLMAAAMAAWGTGQAIWSWYQIVAGVPLPSPSWADVGYLLLPVFALPALLITAARATSRIDASERVNWRRHLMLVLDGLIVVLSVLLLAWQTTLSTLVHEGSPSLVASIIAFAYPVTDLILVTILILLAVFRRVDTADRLPLLLLGLGLAAIAASDSIFSYLVGSGAMTMPPVADVGFMLGPTLIALAVIAPSLRRSPAARRAPRNVRWPQLLLPYVPFSGCVAILLAWTASGHRVLAYGMYLGALILVLVVIRQMITLVENTALLERIREAHARLRFQAFHDPLTGLPNRALFTDRLEHAAQLRSRSPRELSLLFLDVDDFKDINDRFGHHVGDEMLHLIGRRLLDCVRNVDTVARFGGDEFAILLEGDGRSDGGAPEQVSNRILAALAQPSAVDGHTIAVTASIGIASPSRDESDVTVDDLLRRADHAMYTGKRQGKGRIVVHEPLAADHDLLPRLASALQEHSGEGFEVFYQPIVRLNDHTVVAVEALARWRDPPTGPYLPPERFVPALERAGIADQLDRIVLRQACADLSVLEEGLGRPLRLHVNISATWAGSPELVETVLSALARNSLRGDQLVLELTETGQVPDRDSAACNIDRLRSAGVRIALDDFGTGYNTQPLLSRFTVDMVKLDRSATRTNTMGGWARRQLRRGFGCSTHLTVVAEGVETPRQAAALDELGCELAQGYLFGRPAPLAELRSGAAVSPRGGG